MKQKTAHIAIFDTFKTKKNKFTGEAKRQRGIITHLVLEKNPELRTRTSIAHAIAKNNGILWQNIYSGIFKDLDEVLIPSGVVKDEPAGHQGCLRPFESAQSRQDRGTWRQPPADDRWRADEGSVRPHHSAGRPGRLRRGAPLQRQWSLLQLGP